MPHSDTHHADLAAIIHATAQAAVVCRWAQRALLEQDAGSRSTRKDDNSPVTIADWASQAIVIHRLHERLGRVTVVAEENAATLRRPDHASQRARVLEAVRIVWPQATEAEVLDAIDAAHPDDVERSSYFALDPVDGTKGFLRGEQYCVSLALVVDGVPLRGALACPNLPLNFGKPFDEPESVGSLYFAERGLGLYELPASAPQDHPTPIRRLQRNAGSPLRVCESVEAAHTSHSETAHVLARLHGPSPEVLRLDSQCKYAVVGRGQGDAYIRMPSRKGYIERVWDHAAGALIAVEGGCSVTDVAGRTLDFSKGRGLSSNRGIVCAEPRVHAELLAAISGLGLARV